MLGAQRPGRENASVGPGAVPGALDAHVEPT